jgi:hypothetical protein
MRYQYRVRGYQEWTDCDEAYARLFLGSSSGVSTFVMAQAEMLRGLVLCHCGLIDFRIATAS